LILSFTLTLVMMQAIACGSAFYQVSLEGDIDHAQIQDFTTDPTSAFYGIHTPKGWASLPIPVHFGDDLNDVQQRELVEAMSIWEMAVGKQLFEVIGVHESVVGDDFQDLFASLKDHINGKYLFNDWEKTKKKQTVLATAVWNGGERITSGDIHFNNQNYYFSESLFDDSPEPEDRPIVDVRSLALHEYGHKLGLAHVDTAVENGSVMNPSLFIGPGLVTWSLSRGDIRRIQSIYGCLGDACDIEKIFLAILNRQ
jgi:hypothetical protein